jgi:ABC-2 type transport system permease protein
MNKLWLIIQREYLTRVKKKSFIIITLISPLIFVALFTIPALLAVFAGKEQRNIVVKDDNRIFKDSIESNEYVIFTLSEKPFEVLKLNYKKDRFDGVLYIPKFDELNAPLRVTYYSEGQLSISSKSSIERRVSEGIEAYKIQNSGYDENILNSFKTRVSCDQIELTFNESGQLVESDKKNSAGIATAIGYIAGFIIYAILIFYGTMIMRSVMEEKTNRIVEVIISSVKPFQLMMGKIIGVSAVGLTQMLIWIGMTILLTSVVGMFIPLEPTSIQDSMGPMSQEQSNEAMTQLGESLELIKSQNWNIILPVFLIFFLGGYFIYSSLFAAIGSAMGDDMGEGQSLTLLAMFPIIISIIVLAPIVENPSSSLAFWMSVIPFFSPIIMPARIAFEPPLWEVILSVIVLAVTAVFFVWLSGRIYRVGILLYGKKATYKELGKWILSND